MSFRNKYIRLIDWAGNELLHAEYDRPEVDKVLDANRCPCDELNDKSSYDECLQCGGDGYIGDFEVCWEDESDKENCNVYGYINY